MGVTRRQWVGAMGGALASAYAQPRRIEPPRVRTGPILCLYSRQLPGIEYPELGTILNGLGFDGCDLSVEPGGTVIPQQTPVDLVRAIEVIKGDGLDLPVITTSFVSVQEPWARNVLAITGNSFVPFFRAGFSRLSAERVAERSGDIAAMAAYARAARLGMGLPYPAAEPVMRGLDAQWVGYDFDTSQGSVEPTLARLRMIRVRDVRKTAGGVAPCPLGEGIVDWSSFFTALARARFSGPLTVLIDYQPENRLDAIRRDLDFARQHLNAAYEKELDPTSRRPSADSPGAKPPA